MRIYYHIGLFSVDCAICMHNMQSIPIKFEEINGQPLNKKFYCDNESCKQYKMILTIEPQVINIRQQ